ncbi:hypothetical protein K1719_045930 [Acacia pycnantha]|nr:hypothetical protein K1719_045930 [Acacia pycnantha]
MFFQSFFSIISVFRTIFTSPSFRGLFIMGCLFGTTGSENDASTPKNWEVKGNQIVSVNVEATSSRCSPVQSVPVVSGAPISHVRSEVMSSHDNRIKIFKYSELKIATDNFDSERELGRGKHGTVYLVVLCPLKISAPADSAFRSSNSPSFVPMASASRGPMVPPYRVLITGSSKGIGFALAKEFLRAGLFDASVSFSWFLFEDEKVESAVQSLREEFGEQYVWGTKCDVREAEDVKNLVAFAQEKLKYIDIWLLNSCQPILNSSLGLKCILRYFQNRYIL